MSISRFEVFAWVGAVVIVGIMGFMALHGPFNKINKPAPAPIVANVAPLHVKIETDPRTTGSYVPISVTAKVGQRIIFSNISSAPHTVTASNNAFDSGDVATGVSWTFLPQKAGTFQYYCKYHPLMRG